MDPQALDEILRALPFHSIYSGARRAALQSDYSQANMGLSLNSVLNAVVLLAIIASPFAFLLSDFIFSDIALSCALALILFASSIYSGFLLPRVLASRYASHVESDLPEALNALYLHLEIKVPFEQALEHAARGNFASSRLFSSALKFARNADSIPQALSKSCALTSSLQYARAAHQLSIIYSEGSRPTPLLSLAQELSSRQSMQNKLMASRAAMLGLLFIASSCMLPAFYLILAIAAGPLIGIRASPYDALIAYIIAFPLLNFLIFSAMIFSSPAISGAWRHEQLREEAQKKIESMNLPTLSSAQLAALSFALLAALLILSYLLNLSKPGYFLSLAIAFIPIIAYSMIEGQAMEENSALEEELPSLLMAGSSASRISLEKMLEHGKASHSRILALQCEGALRAISVGENPIKVLQSWSGKTPSVLLWRALALLQIGHITGSNIAPALKTCANDILTSFSIVRERQALLAIQSYTIMFASAILVPAILASSLAFASQIHPLNSQLDAPLTSSPGANPPEAPNSGAASILPVSSIAIQAYLFINSIICAYYLSYSQGLRERFAYYAAMLTIASQAVWIFLSPTI